jgi:hypothetical protein
MKLNIIKEFKKDFTIAFYNEIQKLGSRMEMRKVFLLGFLIMGYIYSKPFYIFYKGRLERKYKLKQLKKNDLYVLDK